jgi:hypothetical protein
MTNRAVAGASHPRRLRSFRPPPRHRRRRVFPRPPRRKLILIRRGDPFQIGSAKFAQVEYCLFAKQVSRSGPPDPNVRSSGSERSPSGRRFSGAVNY